MPSIGVSIKQLPPSGYFINIGDIGRTTATATFYQNNGTDSVPSFAANIYATSSGTSTLLSTAGRAIFRDHGKTLVSSGRVFRKVQLITSGLAANTNGVAGVDAAPTAYITGFIELPGNEIPSGLPGGTVGAAAATAQLLTPVARLG